MQFSSKEITYGTLLASLLLAGTAPGIHAKRLKSIPRVDMNLVGRDLQGLEAPELGIPSVSSSDFASTGKTFTLVKMFKSGPWKGGKAVFEYAKDYTEISIYDKEGELKRFYSVKAKPKASTEPTASTPAPTKSVESKPAANTAPAPSIVHEPPSLPPPPAQKAEVETPAAPLQKEAAKPKRKKKQNLEEGEWVQTTYRTSDVSERKAAHRSHKRRTPEQKSEPSVSAAVKEGTSIPPPKVAQEISPKVQTPAVAQRSPVNPPDNGLQGAVVHPLAGSSGPAVVDEEVKAIHALLSNKPLSTVPLSVQESKIPETVTKPKPNLEVRSQPPAETKLVSATPTPRVISPPKVEIPKEVSSFLEKPAVVSPPAGEEIKIPDVQVKPAKEPKQEATPPSPSPSAETLATEAPTLPLTAVTPVTPTPNVEVPDEVNSFLDKPVIAPPVPNSELPENASTAGDKAGERSSLARTPGFVLPPKVSHDINNPEEGSRAAPILEKVSGPMYGRHHEYERRVIFKQNPQSTVRGYDYYIDEVDRKEERHFLYYYKREKDKKPKLIAVEKHHHVTFLSNYDVGNEGEGKITRY